MSHFTFSKSALALILAAMLPLCAQALTVYTGDLNRDGEVDVTDVTTLVSYVLNGTPNLNPRVADLNSDDQVDVSDITFLIHLILDSDTSSPRLTFRVNGVSFTMVRVEPGTFMMGATDEQLEFASSFEKPAHQVTLTKAYYISETEVTQELYEAVMGYNNSYYKDPLNPVNRVGYVDSQSFLTQLSGWVGYKFRLPTEAEWEFAARGGNQSRGYIYAGSDNYDDVAWCRDNSEGMIHHVGTKAPNELGLYDMSGNACEWVLDVVNLNQNPYPSEPQTDPCVNDENYAPLVRGGNFQSLYYSCRVSSRQSSYAGNGDASTTIRLVM